MSTSTRAEFDIRRYRMRILKLQIQYCEEEGCIEPISVNIPVRLITFFLDDNTTVLKNYY